MSNKTTNTIALGKVVLVATALVTIAACWATNYTKPDHFVFEVKKLGHWPFFETRFLYVLLLVFTVAFPLVASFDPRFSYFKKWKSLLPGNLLIAVVFIGWDIFFTKIGVWGFNDRYLTGQRLVGLPWEEWMFFIAVPFSCVFILESVKYFFKANILASAERGITVALALLFFTVGFLKWESIYTSTTFLLCGFFNLFHFLFVKNQRRGQFYVAYLFCLLPFLLVNGVLTGCLTEQPVVFYNPEEFIGLRIVSIPLDDAAYGYLLLMGNFSAYEYFRQRFTA